jgi:hypothetical protein
MVKKAVSKKTAAKKTATKKKTKSKSAAKVARTARAPAPASLAAQDLAKLYLALKSRAKTPDQRADVALVGAVQQPLKEGDHETVGSLLGKVSSWASDKISTFVTDHQEEFKHIAAHGILNLLKQIH